VDKLLGAVLIAPSALYFAAAIIISWKRPQWRLRYRTWFERTTGLQRFCIYAAVLALFVMMITGLDVGFGQHIFGADHRRPTSYVFAVAWTALIIFASPAVARFFERREPVSDDWLLWDKSTEEKPRR
jgi:hypothetical protein